MSPSNLKTTDDFCQALKKDKIIIDHWAYDFLRQSQFLIASEPTNIKLVRVTGVKLGLKGPLVTAKEVYDQALESNLKFCPDELAFQLRLQYKNQPRNKKLFIARKLFKVSKVTVGILLIEHDNRGLCLSCRAGLVPAPPPVFILDDLICSVHDVFIFTRE